MKPINQGNCWNQTRIINVFALMWVFFPFINKLGVSAKMSRVLIGMRRIMHFCAHFSECAPFVWLTYFIVFIINHWKHLRALQVNPYRDSYTCHKELKMHTSCFLNATVENVNAFNKELFLLENAVFWVCFFYSFVSYLLLLWGQFCAVIAS